MNHPLAGEPSLGELLRGFRFNVDYHDWLCRNILPLYDQTFTDGARFVASTGVIALTASAAFGIALFAVSILAISHVSGVPFSRMRSLLRNRIVWVLIGFALIAPIFVTGVDWIRWWVMITFDVGIVFLLFASSEQESGLPPTRRTRVVFACGAILLAVLPVGIVPVFGAPVPM
jgi:phosphatidylserine synthase